MSKVMLSKKVAGEQMPLPFKFMSREEALARLFYFWFGFFDSQEEAKCWCERFRNFSESVVFERDFDQYEFILDGKNEIRFVDRVSEDWIYAHSHRDPQKRERRVEGYNPSEILPFVEGD